MGMRTATTAPSKRCSTEEHYPAFAKPLAREGLALPDYVRREFDQFLR